MYQNQKKKEKKKHTERKTIKNQEKKTWILNKQIGKNEQKQTKIKRKNTWGKTKKFREKTQTKNVIYFCYLIVVWTKTKEMCSQNGYILMSFRIKMKNQTVMNSVNLLSKKEMKTKKKSNQQNDQRIKSK